LLNNARYLTQLQYDLLALWVKNLGWEVAIS